VRRLAFAGATLLIEQPGQVIDLSAKIGDLTLQTQAVDAWC
jgi:hypothetical protein